MKVNQGQPPAPGPGRRVERDGGPMAISGYPASSTVRRAAPGKVITYARTKSFVGRFGRSVAGSWGYGDPSRESSAGRPIPAAPGLPGPPTIRERPSEPSDEIIRPGSNPRF